MPANFDREVARVVAEIDDIEKKAFDQKAITTLDRQGQIRTLGKLLIFDKNLSVHKNEACSFCHTPNTGFTGPIESLNQSAIAYPGSVRARFSNRKPQSYMYAAYAPVLHYDALQGDLVGGNFWDMRASGYRLQSPNAEQAQAPPTNPVEMGLPDSACLVYRLSQASYRRLFETVWGQDSFSIRWPANVERVCSTPAPAPGSDPYPVHLNNSDRARADRAYDGFALAISAYEISPEVSPFTSKYDFVQTGRAKFTAQEALGYSLFRGKAQCNACHRDGGPGEEPLFTDFTASNLGVPRNPDLQIYFEGGTDALGYKPNPDGQRYVDPGVGGFLRKSRSLSGQSNPDSSWTPLATQFESKFQVPTLRNVDMRPSPEFVKAYMHNGYFKSLQEVVHFYNTRDVLPICTPEHPGEKLSCWPPPESSVNVNKKQLGDLGLSPQEEAAIVSFLKTLTDGYQTDSTAH
ncbi:cytochrome-c peroxidase [Terriglobus roseus]|nr:cytochrome c peroxidase [Terriglobus roseus]